MSLQKLAVSDHPLARGLRRARRSVLDFTLPAPQALTRPILWTYLAIRSGVFFLRRVLFCEPLFKAYCTRYGKGVRTDIYLHWVQGKGEIVLGDNVLVDGHCSFTFAARYTARPLLEIGDHTGIGHGCQFTVGKRISIGRHCRVAGDVILFDSSGHPSDPADRLAGLPTPSDDVRPITIGDNVWIGRRAIIFPGVTIGEGSVISTGAVVTSDVPANTVVAGNPARRIAALTPADAPRTEPEQNL